MKPVATQPVTVGLVVGNRGFFPAQLCEKGRSIMIEALEKAGFKVVALAPKATRFGSIESFEEAQKCARLFDAHRKQIDGIVITLPNFGDEKAIANALRWSGLRVPVLVHAWPDDPNKMLMGNRRDSFCGKMSVCNNLKQYGIPFTLTRLHTVDPKSDSFKQDLADFGVTCRVLRALRGLRIGALGTRPTAFNTVRYSEKLLEAAGISVETLDLYELLGWVNELKDTDRAVIAKLKEIGDYVGTRNIPPAALLKMAKFGVAVDGWMKRAHLNATAMQCWTAIEEFFGVVPCTVMSMMSNLLMSSACEVDVLGCVGMYAMAQASGRPSALVDWNNNYADDPDKAVVFHCSNLPRDIFTDKGEDKARMDWHEIIAGTVGKENTYGTVVGRIKTAPLTYLRCTTDDATGRIRAYVGQGEFTDDPLKSFGGYGVVRIPNFQKLLAHICANGYEHHVAVNPSHIAAGVKEALTKYLGWDVYLHE
ncbi:MAG: L-fucose/L-arabinose isomerase family protein [Verrucomicrobiae bacterium]|nr:L-fucose/L-arabinose isomerase family protein [Verrucomicrobiae bacterium]